MQFSTLALGALMALASAQKITVVMVGMNGSLTFTPNNIKVAQGEMVQFQFMGGNHTATQSTFDQPCQPINQNSGNVTGFHTGFVPAAASQAMGMIPTYTVQVNNTNPMWVYCAQGKHCEMGMVMVINENTAANPARSLQAYTDSAKNGQTVIPGGAPAGGASGSAAAPGATGANTAAGSLLSAPSTFSLLALAATVLFW